MTWQRKFSYYRGYIKVRAQGRSVERLVNLSMQKGVKLWNIERRDTYLSFNMKAEEFKYMRPIAKKSGCKLQIIEKKGVPFLTRKSRKRLGLVFGLIFFITVLYALTNFVWFVEIKGNEEIPEEQIALLVKEMGVEPGTLKRRYNFQEIENRLLLEEPDLVWVGIEFEGTRVIINVVERVRQAEQGLFDYKFNDIVAAKDGLVEEIFVLAGQRAIEEGDIVKKGETLISGLVVTRREEVEESDQEEEHNAVEPEGEVEKIKAKGEVWARTWYEGSASVPLKQERRDLTGNKSSHHILKLNSETRFTFGDEESLYDNYEVETKKRSISWRNEAIPVELKTITYYEIDLEVLEIKRETAQKIAKNRALQQAIREKPIDVEITMIEYEELDGEDGFITTKALIEARENIAKIKGRNE